MLKNPNYRQSVNIQVPVHKNFGKFMLDRLKTKEDEIALENIDTKNKLSYKELTLYAVNLATALMKVGVRQGETVAIGCEKRNEFVPTLIAVVFTGATATAYELRSGKAALKHKLNIAQPKFFITTYKFWTLNKDVLQEFECIKHILTIDESFDSIPSTRDLVSEVVDVEMFEPAAVLGQSDVALIYYSSGTTGMSKGIQWTHLGCLLNIIPDFSDELIKTGFVPGEWYHVFDFIYTFKFLASGRKIVYAEEESPESILRSIDQFKANFILTVPAVIDCLLNYKKINEYNVDSLRLIYSGSAPLHKMAIERVKRRFPNSLIQQAYGMTEVGDMCSEFWSPKGSKSGSVGTPTPGVTLKISDLNTGEALGPNDQGEICVKGPALMKGYVGMDLSKFTDNEGFFRTGDRGYYDEDGYFFIVGRFKEIMVYNGYKIAPVELETILQMHPGVREAGVVGRPAAELGELPTAFVVRQPGSNVTEKELEDYVSQEVAPYMQLRGGVQFIEKMPRNLRGKIIRQPLRDMLEANVDN